MGSNKYYLISVESRKGGVGKTTAALNLGSLLKERYHVLILDIDITGTSISAIRQSRFWESESFLLSYSDGSIINLLQYFTNSFLSGEKGLVFSSTVEDGTVLVKNDAINVMASELYGASAELLYDPSLLLENLHVYWLTKMISHLCESFSSCFPKEESVIILDNSPGFVGIGKAVHSIFTDIGPERAKFLTVSSLDIQDFESCLKSANNIHDEYLDKFYGSHFPETQKGDEDFYAQVQLSGSTEYVYYKTKEPRASVSKYQGMIVNKVAKGIVEGRYFYDFAQRKEPRFASFFSSLFPDGVNNYLVPFDSVLMTQFYGVFGGNERIHNKKNHAVLKKRLATIEGQLRILEDSNAENLPYDLLRRANGLDRSIDALKGALIACGYEVIASKFNWEWSPISPLIALIEVLKEEGVALESFELYVPRRARMAREMEYFREIADHSNSFIGRFFTHEWFVSAVASVACELSFCYSNTIKNDIFELSMKGNADDRKSWAKRINDSLIRWMNEVFELYNTKEAGDKKLGSFILSDYASSCDCFLQEISDSTVFVSLVKKSISRLMDVVPDTRTLLNTIRTITVENEGSYSIDVNFVPFLNDTIIEKKYDYNQAKVLMPTILRDENYMAAFKRVLDRVIINWGI